MKTIDLRTTRCPMSLVILKQFLLEQQKSTSITNRSRFPLLFKNQHAMQDVIRYLEKKSYHYSTSEGDNSATIVVQPK